MITIGQRISPILEEIEKTLWEYESYNSPKPGYTNNGFRAAIKIFVSVIMDKMWDLQENENIPFQDRENMATKAGEAVRSFVKTYTDVDCHDLYIE